LDALPFSISPEEALESFRHWAEQDQGLRYLMSYDSVRIGAAYVPVWSFDVNIRFAVSASSSSKSKQPNTTSYDWKPSLFQAYGDSSVVHLPGLSAYAGYSYRRSLVNPVHSTTLVFMGDRTERFGGWMLRDMTLKATGQPVSVVPDAWNATQARAFAVIEEELNGIAQQEWAETNTTNANTNTNKVEVQTQLVNSRRVYMPTYVIDYSIAGLEYRAFVSGCDKAASVSGVSHQILGNTIFNSDALNQSSRHFLMQLSQYTSRFLSPQTWPFVIRMLGPLLSVLRFGLLRIWAAIPVLGMAGGAFAGFRKVLQPWMDNRSASAEWERQRENEALLEEEDQDGSWGNDFQDSTGRAQAYFVRNRVTILNHLSGPQAHEQGDYDWYKDWQEWARQQWEKSQSQQQQQQSQQYGYGQRQQQQQQQQTTRRQGPPKQEFKWDFDPNDAYSVLGIYRGATKEQVSAAFRKNMLQYHPDTQPNASEAQKLRALERSKLITEAYRKIKTELKR
jgi:DnaJ-domain-containing protein 1